MSKLVWDAVGSRFYETGVSAGVLYVQEESGSYGNGVAWNGITAVNESPSGAESTALYADDIKYLSLLSAEDFGATIEAYMYPDEFAQCNGEASLGAGVVIGQQARRPFGFSYKTKIGNDTVGQDYGYKIHIIYGAQASPSERSHSTVNESPEAVTMSWTITTTPITVTGAKPTAHLTIDSKKVSASALQAIEEALYGSTSAEPKLLTPDEIKAIIDSNPIAG